jgi:hypothetical protein
MDTVSFIGAFSAMVMITLVLMASAGKINSHFRGVRTLMLGSSALVSLCIGLTIMKWLWN